MIYLAIADLIVLGYMIWIAYNADYISKSQLRINKLFIEIIERQSNKIIELEKSIGYTDDGLMLIYSLYKEIDEKPNTRASKKKVSK